MTQTPQNRPQQYNHEPMPPVPEAYEVSPRIWKFVIPIPFPLRTVNMYALVGQEGWALIDAGIGTPEARTALATALQKANLHIEDLRTLVLTHHHPDHVGLSGELQEQSGAKVYMHPLDQETVQIHWSNSMANRFSNVSSFLTRHGLPRTELWYTKADRSFVHSIIQVPPKEHITAVEDNQHIDLAGEQYRVIWTPGHADGQICLLCESDGVFIAADHVLPRITPNIGLYSEHERPNPLDDYLNSLAKVANLPVSIVLPGHGEPFQGLAERVTEIIAHHEERLAYILDLLADRPQHAYSITEQLFGARLKSDEARRMAIAEVVAHLEYLYFQEKVERLTSKDELIRYAVR
jgi:glyoxylase-like metal-dependent hydrolase (beta-lactamase superfamily II)